MRHGKRFFARWLRISVAAGLILGAVPAAAGVDWSEHDPNSTRRIDHSLWGQLLDAALIPYDKVRDQVNDSKWSCRSTGSRIPSCDYGVGTDRNKRGVNLVAYKYFKPQFAFHIRTYLRQMGQVRISSYNRDEQLAYWLNVHNAAVMATIHKHYPVDSVYDLRPRPRQRPEPGSPWAETVITVEGEPLSLYEIEQEVIFANWDDPMVVYGLYDGSVGGPTLRKEPYTGPLVHSQLEANGRAFVGSLRIMRLRGEEARVSTTYAWAHKLFDGAEEIIAHIQRLAGESLRTRLRTVRRVRAIFYDYELADFTPNNDLQDRMMVDRFVDYNVGPNQGAGPFQ